MVFSRSPFIFNLLSIRSFMVSFWGLVGASYWVSLPVYLSASGPYFQFFPTLARFILLLGVLGVLYNAIQYNML